MGGKYNADLVIIQLFENNRRQTNDQTKADIDQLRQIHHSTTSPQKVVFLANLFLNLIKRKLQHIVIPLLVNSAINWQVTLLDLTGTAHRGWCYLVFMLSKTISFRPIQHNGGRECKFGKHLDIKFLIPSFRCTRPTMIWLLSTHLRDWFTMWNVHTFSRWHSPYRETTT